MPSILRSIIIMVNGPHRSAWLKRHIASDLAGLDGITVLTYRLGRKVYALKVW